MGVPCPLVFAEFLSHDRFKHFNPQSAGFCKINDDGKVEVYGESISLKLKFSSDDEQLLQKVLIPSNCRPCFENLNWLKEMSNPLNDDDKEAIK